MACKVGDSQCQLVIKHASQHLISFSSLLLSNLFSLFFPLFYSLPPFLTYMVALCILDYGRSVHTVSSIQVASWGAVGVNRARLVRCLPAAPAAAAMNALGTGARTAVPMPVPTVAPT